MATKECILPYWGMVSSDGVVAWSVPVRRVGTCLEAPSVGLVSACRAVPI